MLKMLLVSVLGFLCVVTGLRMAPTRLLSQKLYANKIDGITIIGEIQPMQNCLLVKVRPVMATTAGGIFIPDNAKERPTEGTVVAAGPGRVHPETGLQLDNAVKQGEGVIYGKYDGTEVRYNDENHQLIRDDDVLLIFKGKEPTFANTECVKDQVMVQLPPKNDATESGIITQTAESMEKRADRGIVVKVGPGRQAGNGQIMAPQVQPGESVRFRDYAGADVKLEGKEYRVVRAYDILAKM